MRVCLGSNKIFLLPTPVEAEGAGSPGSSLPLCAVSPPPPGAAANSQFALVAGGLVPEGRSPHGPTLLSLGPRTMPRTWKGTGSRRRQSHKIHPLLVLQMRKLRVRQAQHFPRVCRAIT